MKNRTYFMVLISWILWMFFMIGVGVKSLMTEEASVSPSKTNEKSTESAKIQGKREIYEQIFEAEDFFVIDGDADKMFAKEVLDYTGGGYLKFGDTTNAQASFIVYGEGQKTIYLRYAMTYEEVYVDIMSGDETIVPALRLEGTGGDWLETAFVVDLKEAKTELRIAPLLDERQMITNIRLTTNLTTNLTTHIIQQAVKKNRRLPYTLRYDDLEITGPPINVYEECNVTLEPKTDGLEGTTLYRGIRSHICTYRWPPTDVLDDQKIEYKLYLKGTCKVTVYLINHWREKGAQRSGEPTRYAQGDHVDILVDGMTTEAYDVELSPKSMTDDTSRDLVRDEFILEDPNEIQESNEFYLRAVRRLTIVLSNARGREYTLGIRPSRDRIANRANYSYHFHVAPIDSGNVVVEVDPVLPGSEGDVSIDLSPFSGVVVQKQKQKKQQIEVIKTNIEREETTTMVEEDRMGFNLDHVRVVRGAVVGVEIMKQLGSAGKVPYKVYESEVLKVETYLFRGRTKKDYTGKGYVNMGVKHLFRRELSPRLRFTVKDVDEDEHQIYEIALRYASPEKGLRVRVFLNDKVVAEIFELPPTGGWAKWKISSSIKLETAIKNGGIITVERIGNDPQTVNFNFDHIRLIPVHKDSPKDPEDPEEPEEASSKKETEK